MEKEDFLETCVVLCALERDAILKTILKEKYSNITQTDHATALPSDLDLLLHEPTSEDFVEYAFALCSLQHSKEDLTRHLISTHFDAAVQSALSRSRGRTHGEEVPKSRKKARSGVDLPSKLNLFTDGETILATMSEIIPRFFPGMVILSPGVYGKGCHLVLQVVDNGRYKNSWSSAGIQNKLTWYTSEDDANRQVFDKVTDKTSVVHVVRNRNSELRYMGKCIKTEHVDRDGGACVMYIA